MTDEKLNRSQKSSSTDETDRWSWQYNNTYFKQIQNLDAKLIVKVGICRVSHIIDENEPISLCLNTKGERNMF